MTAAFAANTPATYTAWVPLEVDSTGSGQSGLQCCRPSLVGPSQSPHLVRRDAKVTEHRAERLVGIDAVQELLPDLGG
jgi:hypothetical protein